MTSTESRSLLRRGRLLLAEFLVIVVGVLVALGVDQWNENRTDRVVEARYLERLKADLTWDTAHFADFDRRALQTKAEVLTELLEEDALQRLTSRPAFADDLNYSSFVALPANRPATFQELQSTGNLSLIQDVELRGSISRYYAGFDHISQILAEPFGDYRTILEGHLPGVSFYRWRVEGVEPDPAELTGALTRLLNDPDLSTAVNSELAYTAGMMYYLRFYHSEATSLLSQLEEVLE